MVKVLGIDLGTSTSEAAVIIDGKPVIIPNQHGEKVIPSVVGVDDSGYIIVGSQAYDQILIRPDKTIIEVKRKMGTDRVLKLGYAEYKPEEISAEILKYIKRYAEEYLKEPIDSAVITVPAYFNERQRKATLEAGKLAGFNVKRIINEPTAAALCYGIDHLEEESNILIYDLGGGTFDVTLLEMFNGVLEVKASNGVNTLGGSDFDKRLIDYLITEFEKKEGVLLRGNIYAQVKLKAEAEKCKIALSSQDSYEVTIPMIAEKDGVPVMLHETVTVEIFESLIADLIEKTSEPVNSVLKDSGLSREDIDLIILTGGSTRIPLVKRYVEELLGQKPRELIDPDLSVALGAAIQAGIINEEISSEDGILITDVCPFSLGVKTVNDTGYTVLYDCMTVVIPRNSTIPSSKKSIFTTFRDYQTVAEIAVFQGESESTRDNLLLGNFNISGIPSAKAKKEKIEVTFSYNINGMLQVTAKILSNNRSADITINTKEFEYVDVSAWKDGKNAVKFRSVIRKVEKVLSENMLDFNEEQELENLVYALKKGIVKDSELDDLKKTEDRIMRILEEYL